MLRAHIVSVLKLLDEDRILILSETEKLSAACQQLQVCAKTPVQGKSAIFQKVIEYNRYRLFLYISEWSRHE